MKKQIEYLIDSLIEKTEEIKQLKEVVIGLKHESKEQMQAIQKPQQSIRGNEAELTKPEHCTGDFEDLIKDNSGEWVESRIADLKPEKELKLDWDTITKDNVVIDCSEGYELEKFLDVVNRKFDRHYINDYVITLGRYIICDNSGWLKQFSEVAHIREHQEVVLFQDIVIK